MPENLTSFEAKMFTPGESWPPQKIRERNERYNRLAALYENRHEEIFRDDLRLPDHWRYISVPFPQLISHVARDMLFRENPKYERTDESEETADAVSRIIKQTRLWQTVRNAALPASYLGDAYLRVGVNFYGKAKTDFGVCIDTVDPRMVIPVSDEADGSVSRALYQTWKVPYPGRKDEFILYAERHRAGEVWLRKFHLRPGNILGDPLPVEAGDGPEVQEFDQAVNLLVHVPNRRASFGLYGRSDYAGIQDLIREIDNRETRRARILDMFSSPKLMVPESAMQRDEKTGQFVFSADEVIPVPPDIQTSSLGYLTWDARLESAEKQIEALTEWMFLGSDTSEATFGKGVEKNESGIALYLKMSRTLLSVENKVDDWEQAISSVLESAQIIENWELMEGAEVGGASYEVTKPSIQIKSGLPSDSTTVIDETLKLRSAGLVDDETALKRIFPNLEQKEVAALLERVGNVAQERARVTSPFRQRVEQRRAEANNQGENQ